MKATPESKRITELEARIMKLERLINRIVETKPGGVIILSVSELKIMDIKKRERLTIGTLAKPHERDGADQGAGIWFRSPNRDVVGGLIDHGVERYGSGIELFLSSKNGAESRRMSITANNIHATTSDPENYSDYRPYWNVVKSAKTA